MNLCVETIAADTWEKSLATAAHRAVFSEHLPPEYDRIDFALLAFDGETQTALGYVTCRELSAEDVYLKHGGAFEPAEKTLHVLGFYRECLAVLTRKGFKRVTTLVENDNITHIKMALTVGFKPIGIRNFKGSVLIELFKELL